MGESLDGRSDIFSLGVVAFEMLSGQQPFPGNNVTSILYKLVHADPVRPPNLEVLGLLPDKWHQVFSKVLSKNPPDRYETGAVFVSELELCLGSWFGALEGETLYVSESTQKGGLGPPPGEPGSRGARASGNLLKTDDSADEDDEEVIFAGSAETMKDNPAFWGSTDSNRVDAPPTSSTKVFPEDSSADQDKAQAETKVESIEHGPTRAYGVMGAQGVSDDKTRTASSQLPPTQAEVPAANLSTRADRSAGRSGVSLATVSATMTTVGTLWKQKRTMIAAVGGVLILLLAGLAVRNLYTLGGETQSPPTSMTSSIEPVSLGSVPIGTLAPRSGILTIESEPVGASVLINGSKLGLTPLELSELELGSYTVRLEKAGYETEELIAELNVESPRASLSVPMSGQARRAPSLATLRVVSTPPGAQVLLDGKPTGSTPLERLRARPGERTIRLQLMGFEPWETTVQLRAGASESISAALEPRETAPPPPEPVTTKVTEGDLVERGLDVVDPTCIKCPGVRYPERARRAQLEGSVLVSFIVTETGSVQDIVVEESAGDVFDQDVIETLQSWQHEPATKNGVRVKVRLQKRFTFRRGN